MAHPYNHVREVHAGRKRAHEMSKHFKRGGRAKHDDEAEDKKLIKKEISKHVKHADMKAEGGKVHSRYARGGRAKKAHTHINIVVAPKGGDASQGAAGAPPISPGGGAGPPPMPPKPPMGPMGAGMPGMPPGMGMGPPGMGGPPGMPTRPGMGPGGPPMMRKRGGRTGMKYGAGSGEGREEKARKYGAKGKHKSK
jgi:hypothetical protein